MAGIEPSIGGTNVCFQGFSSILCAAGKNKNHTITGELDLPSDGTSGVIVAQGGLYSGYALYLVDGELRYEYNAFDENRYKIRSSKKVPAGDSVVKAVYKVGMPATCRFYGSLNDGFGHLADLHQR